MLTALTFRYRPGYEPALIVALRQWLGGWAGIGRVEAGMVRQGFDLQLTGDVEGWRATFFATACWTPAARPRCRS
jgi:hypothetical protein